MQKQEEKISDATCPPSGPVTVESGEDLLSSEAVGMQGALASPPASRVESVSPFEEARSASDKTESDSNRIEEETPEVISEELELLTFNLAEEEYAVDIGVIQEITKLTEITIIPRIQSYIKGIITLRGNVIPVFDMRARLGLPPFVKEPKNRLIICTAEEGMVAMLVDRVNDVVRLVRQNLEDPPASVAAMDAGFIKNIARHDNRLLILLDIQKTLRMSR